MVRVCVWVSVWLAACGGSRRTEPPPPAPIATAAPVPDAAPPQASCARTWPPTNDELASDPAFDPGFGGGGLPSGGGRCDRGNAVGSMEVTALASDSPNLDPMLRAALLECVQRVACSQMLPYSMRACFTIQPDGSVTLPGSDTVNGDIRSCVVDALGSVRFPDEVRDEPFEVTYELTYRP